MKYLLDTDHLSIHQRQSGPEYASLSARLLQHTADEVALCIVSFHEQVLGCHTYVSRARDATGVVRGYQMLGRVIQDFTTAPCAAVRLNRCRHLCGITIASGAHFDDGFAHCVHRPDPQACVTNAQPG